MVALVWIITASIAKAQPVITELNMPQLGDLVTKGICSYIPNETVLDAQTGANYNWDFSSLNEISTTTLSFVDPSNTSLVNEFSGSDLCGASSDDGRYTFYSVSNSMLVADGSRLINGLQDTVVGVYTDGEVVLELPGTFDDNGYDEFSGDGYIASNSATISGYILYAIDGYGSLQLPNGSYQNVLRYNAVRSESFTLGVNTFPETRKQWIWISQDYRFWLLVIESINDLINGSSYNVWYQKTPIPVGGNNIVEEMDVHMSVYPNPVTENGILHVDGELNSGNSIQLLDSRGRLVGLYPATQTISLDGVAMGSYMLRILDEQGQVLSSQKLVVN